MKYDFTSILDRRGKDAIAVDAVGAPGSSFPAPREGFDVIPMWVADMNFPALHTIQEAMIERAKLPTFGYFSPRTEYYDSIIRWHETRNGVTGLTAANIGYENGVLGGVATAMRVLCDFFRTSTALKGIKTLINNDGISCIQEVESKNDSAVLAHGLSKDGKPRLLYCAETEMKEGVVTDITAIKTDDKYYTYSCIGLVAVSRMLE